MAAMPPRCELEPREGVDRHGIGGDSRDVAEDDRRAFASAE